MTRLTLIITIAMLSCSAPKKDKKAEEPIYFFVTDSGVVHADFCIGTYDKSIPGKLISPGNSDIHKYKVCSSCIGDIMKTLTSLGLKDVANKFIHKDSTQSKTIANTATREFFNRDTTKEKKVAKKKLDW